MQQDRGRGGSDQNMKQNQDRGLKPPSQQQEPQRCPRCDSVNTKFCYYNNYSLSQPRYFCKTCRRYWTQGGTLRNVPVGGGCRKAAGNKRTKISYYSSSSAADQNSSCSPPLLPQIIPHQQNLTSTSPQTIITATSSGSLASPLSAAMSSSTGGSYYPGGGFLSSLAAIQSMNQPLPLQTFSQPPANQGGGELGISSSSLGLLQGYGMRSFGSQLQHHQPINRQTQFFDMGNRENTVKLNYPSDQEFGLIDHQSSKAAAAGGGSSSSTQPNWHQNFLNDITNPKVVVSEAANSWNINSGSRSRTTAAAGNTNSTTGASSFNPNQWPHFPGYGAP